MTIKELIEKLENGFNPDAQVKVIAHCKKYDFSISIGGCDGVTRDTAEDVSFYVDALCKNESVS